MRQTARNTLWLALHPRGFDLPRRLVWWRLLRGRCVYCGDPECID